MERVPEVLAHFSRLAELKSAPSSEYQQRIVHWPKNPLASAALPGGLLSLQGDKRFDASEALVRLFTSAGDGSVYFWGIGQEEYGIYSGPYSEETLSWIRRELIFSPVCILRVNPDLVLITDEQLHYSTFGGSEEDLEQLESFLSPPATLKDLLADWIEDDGVGFGAADREWATTYLLNRAILSAPISNLSVN